MGSATLTYFTCLAARNMELPDLDSTINAASVQSYAMSSQAGS